MKSLEVKRNNCSFHHDRFFLRIQNLNASILHYGHWLVAPHEPNKPGLLHQNSM